MRPLPQATVPGRGGKAGQIEADRHRHAHGIAARVDHHRGQLSGVEVDRQDRVLPQLVHRWDVVVGVFQDASRYQRWRSGS
jgi:hypothetical protein